MEETHPFAEHGCLRAWAVEVDAISRQAADFASLWSELVTGRLSIREHFSSRERHYLVLAARSKASPLTARQLGLLERLLTGQPQKGVAIDYRLSASTVTGALTEALRVLGLNVSASRAPVMLCLMLHAYRGEAPVRGGRASEIVVAGQTFLVVSTPRLEEALGAVLSSAEAAVIRLRADGKSHAEIASLRKTSLRTIANQVASASRKLGVSGRNELLSYLSRVASSHQGFREATSA